MCDNLYEKKQSINIHIVKEKQILIVPENCADNPSYSIENFYKAKFDRIGIRPGQQRFHARLGEGRCRRSHHCIRNVYKYTRSEDMRQNSTNRN